VNSYLKGGICKVSRYNSFTLIIHKNKHHMLQRLGIILILALLLVGCQRTCCVTPQPLPTNSQCCDNQACDCCNNRVTSPVPFSKCSRCCIKKPYPRRQCPRACGGGHCALLSQLACQGVQVVELGNTVKIILFTDNCMETGTADIDESCHPILDNVAELLDSYGQTCGPISIRAFTDNVGDVCGKNSLAQHIADSVMGYLWSHGIPLDRLVARGCGYYDPIASPHTPRGNAYNRRVEITLWRKSLAMHTRCTPD